ncbi:MAG: C45 family peptidase, partial [Actinomycetota bacterium]|nr:C45 family peptidase [Actinomycetota bacterium]
GEAARDRVHRSIELYSAVFRHYAELEWSEVRDRAGSFAEWFDDTDVQLLPELEGIAEGASVEAEDVLALNVRTEVMFGLDTRRARAAAKECTAIGAASPATAEGRVLVAQTWDWKPAARDTCVLLAMRPTGRPAFATFVEAGLLAKCGMNEAGIGIATNALTSSRDRGEPGVPFHAILRRLLTSSSHAEAVSEVTTRIRGSSANYVVGSRDGQISDLEVGPGGADTAWRVDDAVVCHANHFVRPDRPFKDLALLDGPESPDRLASVRDDLSERPIDVASIERALRSHAGIERGPGSVCAHGDPSMPAEADYVTIAGIVLDLTAAELHLTRGNPCETPFETHVLQDLLASR